MKEITLNEIMPFIRFVHRFSPTSDNKTGKKWCDHRLFYVISGEGVFTIEGVETQVNRGFALLIPSGTEYSIIASKNNPLSVIGVNFDYLSLRSHITDPVFSGFLHNEAEQIEGLCFTDHPALNAPIKLSKMNIIEENMLYMLDEYEKSLVLGGQRLRAFFLLVLTEILRVHTLEKNKVRQTDRKAEEILEYIREHYAEHISGESLAKTFNYNKNHINYLIKLKTGTSVHQYLINYRLSRAVQLLRTTTLSATVISRKVGFQDYVYFLKCFKRHIGNSTKEIRENF